MRPDLGLIGESEAFQQIIERLPLVAESHLTVLIEGESGTGKEVLARAVHTLSGRQGAFTPINCGAIPADLFERELFGHKRSAFTGAATSENGLVHMAQGGTLFLDEVDCLPLHVQSKLLRFLQEKEYRPLGSTLLLRADVRVLAASNANLAEVVRLGGFRQDLFYRLNALPLMLPPLRERRSDIPRLADHFLRSRGGQEKHFSAEALMMMQEYSWPGNIRELQNVVERAVIFSRDRTQVLASDVLLPSMRRSEVESFQAAKRRVIANFERSYLEALLATHGGNIASAARTAKKNRRALWELLRKHSISADRYRARDQPPQQMFPLATAEG
jgi:two-component system, NtrC family, response regulator GlrR